MENKKIEDLKARQAKELEALIKTEDAKTAIVAALTAVTVVKFSPHVAYADYTVTAEPVEDLSAAICVAEILNPLALFKVKGSCTAFVPETYLDRYLKKNPNAKEEAVNPYIYHIDGLRQYAEEKTLECYVDAAGYMVQVEIPVKRDLDTYRDYEITFDRRGNPHRHYCRLVNKSGHFLHSIKWWTSEDHPNKFTLY